MPTEPERGAEVRIPPPLVYVGAVLLGVAAQAWILPLPLSLPIRLRVAVAAVLGLAGLLLMAAALGLFRRTGQDPKPWLPTPELLTTGIYRFTRNPMYVSMALLQAALGVALGNGWIVLAVPAVLFVVWATAVRHEEAYLESRFGDAYREYRRRVRRWV